MHLLPVIRSKIKKPMNKSLDLSRPNPQAEAAMKKHQAAIERVTIDANFAYDTEGLLADKISWMAQHCQLVLDIGQSSRGHSIHFDADKLETVDINRGDNPPDIIDDICAPNRLQNNRYDGLVCLSVLEHVYDPFAAIEHIHNLLQPGGYLLFHVPFMFRYHAPADLAFTDCYRFSRDGLAWMLRDFSQVTLYPIRGPYSSMFNLQKSWKTRVEKIFGMAINRWIDKIGLRLFRRPTSELQVSGYYAWAIK
ncbi:MAG: SAM-dependent methyltransferase [Gammaproteobacteria bacterium]|jgi:SAM-dependent methyltransferase